MPDSNITISGTVAFEPELRFTGSGKGVCTLRLVVNHGKKDPATDKWVKDKGTWYDVTAWEQMAENVAATIRKGDRVIVTGRPYEDSYEKDGVERKKMAIQAEDIGLSMKWARAEVERNERAKPSTVPDEDEEEF